MPPQVSIAVLFTALLVVGTGDAHGQSRTITDGQAIAGRDRAMCHAIGPTGASPNPRSPPFRDLNERFRIEDMETGVLGDLLNGHPAMPNMRLTPGQVRDLLEYLKSLRTDGVALASPKAEAPGDRSSAARLSVDQSISLRMK